MHNKVQKPLRKRVPLSLIFWIIAVICSGGGSEVTKGVWWGILLCEGLQRKDERITVERDRQTHNEDELLLCDSSKMDSMTVTMAGHKARNGSRTDDPAWPPGRFVPFLLTPTHWKLENSRTRRSQK